MRLMKLTFALLFACSTFGFVAGCQSGGSATSATAGAAPQRAVVITTGNGRTAVYLPSPSSPEGVELLASDKEGPVCVQCQRDAREYILHGTPMAAKCSVCGATRVPVTIQETHATN